MWNSEYQMEISHGQEFLHPFIQPFQLVFLLAGRAMPVPARIVRFAYIIAIVTFFKVASQCGSPARRQQVDKPFGLSLNMVIADIIFAISGKETSQGYLFLHNPSSPSKVSSGLTTLSILNCCTWRYLSVLLKPVCPNIR